MASKLDSRVMYLENQLSNCLENLDAFSVQLTVIQDFLQKQFGSRFVDYAVNRGVFIEKGPPTSNRAMAKNSYYGTLSSGGNVTGMGSTLTSASMVASSSKGYGLNSYVEEPQADEEDPLAFVEIIEDSGELKADAYEGDEGDYDAVDYGNNGHEPCYDDGEEEEQEEDNSDNFAENNHSSAASSSNLVIVNCVSEKIKNEAHAIRLPSPPPITPRPPAARTYTKNSVPMISSEAQKLRPPGNFLGRKRPAAPSSSTNSTAPSPKMPVLHPQGGLLQPKPEPQDDYDMLDFSALTDADPNIDGFFGEGKTIDAEYNEDLRDYYDVLPDKSVQCKICDKILKAGWHKFGRHYRTHTGEKPFSCPICGENFARKDNMNNHIKSKHENKPRPRPNVDGSDLLSDFSPMYYLPSELC